MIFQDLTQYLVWSAYKILFKTFQDLLICLSSAISLLSVVYLVLCGIFTQELTAIGDELKKQIENERNEIERLTVSTVQPLLMATAVASW